MSKIFDAIRAAEGQPSRLTGTPAQRRLVLSLIWTAYLATLVVYAVVGATVTIRDQMVDAALLSTLRPTLALTAAASAIASLWVRRKSTALLLADAQMGRPPQAAEAAAQRLQASCILVWAMCEAVGIFGLVLCLLARNVGEYYPFGAAAAVLFYVHRPNAWQIERVLGRPGEPA